MRSSPADARRTWAHAGVGDRVTCVVGRLGDGGATLDALAGEHGFAAGALDFVFTDHDKRAYLPDLLSILGRGWSTVEHKTHLEYSAVPDVVPESRFLGVSQG